MPPKNHTSMHAKWQAEEVRKLALLQQSIERQRESLRRYCFEIKYGKLTLN